MLHKSWRIYQDRAAADGTGLLCRNGITGEVFPVHVQPEYADEIDEEFTSGKGMHRVPARDVSFMRKNPEGPGMVCAIYATRPQISGNSGVITW